MTRHGSYSANGILYGHQNIHAIHKGRVTVQHEIGGVLKALGTRNYEIRGNPQTKFSKPATIGDGQKGSIAFCSSKKIPNAIEVIKKSKASVILVDRTIRIAGLAAKGKAIVAVENPQLTYMRILKKCFPQEVKKREIHPSSIVHKEAKIHPSVYIGPNCIIGECRIGANSIIHANVAIDDGVSIGKHVTIYPYCLIGYTGFGHIRNENGEWENFPHYGGVIIEDNVEVFPFTNIDRGALGDTRIGRGTKIDHFCHIGHNVSIGTNSMIAACTVVAGSARIGDDVYVAPNCTIRDYLHIGDKSFIGMGAVVTRDVPRGIVVVGNPARPFNPRSRLSARQRRQR